MKENKEKIELHPNFWSCTSFQDNHFHDDDGNCTANPAKFAANASSQTVISKKANTI